MFLTVISNFTSLVFSLVTISYISSLTISGTIFYNFSWFSYSFCLGVSVISKFFSSPTILKHLTFFFLQNFKGLLYSISSEFHFKIDSIALRIFDSLKFQKKIKTRLVF
uniref:Uncharacterized protein n=1 Tax=Cacopsylla melanoneura TaxID=428564 RepID=A0A8D8RJC9_9HEMI